ncbi:hypothetical protein [Thalassobacillus pellis]|uniref:hypothetical protein n=1 Tax=Thalassobacillus pellis TaxID=748008 RepID=UPI001960583B|nr:hypothetical protein [Thalassobacillus pellis]MBM7554570.1 hypothetical protein [Thalassobacillus pellis]
MRQRLTIPSVIVTVFLVLVGCQDNGNKDAPTKVAIAWVHAEVQQDEAKMWELLAEKSKVLDREDEADHTFSIDHMGITAWQAGAERYFYEVSYEHPETNEVIIEQMEIIRTQEGWKRTEYADVKDFESRVKDLQPEVLKEMYAP